MVFLNIFHGFYDTITGCFIYYSGLIFDEADKLDEPPTEIQNYQPPTTPTPTPIDYTSNLDNINNTINNTNIFLMDNNFNEGDVNISSPSVSNQEVVSGSDNFFNNYMSTFANLYNGSDVVTIDIYIPNYINNTGTKFITIRSDMIKNYLINNPIIPGTSFNIYNIIQVIWTALFGFWFVNIITKFVTSLYSGELMSDKALKELSSTYTNVTSSML